MGLNVFSFGDKANFTPKLNDTFRVKIKWSETDSDYEEFQSCIGFTIPQPKYKDEYQYFGNNTHRYLIPDYESFEDLKLEFNEYQDLRISQFISKCLAYIFDFKNRYYINKYIYQILIEILDNNFQNVIYTYDFRYCKITNYDNYELSFDSNDPTKISASFSYMYFHQGDITVLDYSSDKMEIDPIEPDIPTIEVPEKTKEEETNPVKVKSADKDDKEGKDMSGQLIIESSDSHNPTPDENSNSNGIGILENTLTGNALKEYEDYIAKLKTTKNFNELTDAFIFYDIETNTKYAIKNNEIVKSYVSITATGESNKENGEAPEGVYQLQGLGNTGTHGSRKADTQKVINGLGLNENDVISYVAKNGGSVKTAIETLAKKAGKSSEQIKQVEASATNLKSENDYNYLTASNYSSNLIDEGNNNGYRETENSGIHSHAESSTNATYLSYMKKKKAGIATTVEEDTAARKAVEGGGWTHGCSVMTAQDNAWEKQFINENGGKVYEVKANGTTNSNKKNDK